MFVRAPIAICIFGIATGCSLYPLPQDTSGYNTYQIVANIRCEARDALRASAITYLKYYDEPIHRDGRTGPQLAEYLIRNPSGFENISIKDLKGSAKKPFYYYSNSQVAYEFSLKGLDSNTQGFDLSLKRSFGLRQDSLGLKNEALRSRDVTRSFFVWDRFEDLIKVNDNYCAGGKPVNIVYPITGGLPIYDLVYSYIETNELEILTSRTGLVKTNTISGTKEAPAIPAMGDTIVFKTRLDGNMSPSFNYNPIGSGLLVSALSLKNDNYREDTHTLTITVSTAPVKGTQSARSLRTPPASDTSRRSTAQASVDTQRQIRFENAIINLSNSFTRIAP